MKSFIHSEWEDYELLDCGNGNKLERFGEVVLIRPEPRAYWPAVWDDQRWKRMAHGMFETKGSKSGKWVSFKHIPEQWNLSFQTQHKTSFKFQCRLTKFKHIGIFPEQASNWNFITKQCRTFKNPKILNLFAYTGGASLAARAAGAEVYHVDSIKQVISWAKTNQDLSGLDLIRWVLEDAMKFVTREVKRGKSYDGIILDPPAFGLGASGQRWILEDLINDLLQDLSKLLSRKGFIILNMYSVKTTPTSLFNLIQTNFKNFKELTYGETAIKSTSGLILPAGFCARATGYQV